MATVQYLKEVVEQPQLTETSTLLPANLLVPSITLIKANGDKHYPLEEHILRRPGLPNLHTYTIPYMNCEIHTYIKNLGTTAVSLLQTCVPTHGECLSVVVALDQIKLPLTRLVRGDDDDCKGFDILDPDRKHTLLELRFLYARMPKDGLVSTKSVVTDLKKWRQGHDWSEHDSAAVPKQEPVSDDLYDHSLHEKPKRTSWWPFGGKASAAKTDTSNTSTRCDVIAENADDTQHAAVLAQMRAMLLA